MKKEILRGIYDLGVPGSFQSSEKAAIYGQSVTDQENLWKIRVEIAYRFIYPTRKPYTATANIPKAYF